MKLSYNDKQHAYWLDGKRCKGVTSVAKIPDNTYSLEQWAKRMVVTGMALESELVRRARAHFDERDLLDDIVEEAHMVAKAHQAAGRGQAIHKETERADLGLDWIDSPETRAIRAAWTQALEDAGLVVDPDYVERIVVYPDEKVAGRFDRLCHTTDGRHVIVDVKTGESAIKYPHSTVCQLALYSHAPLIAGPLRREGKNEVTEDFYPMPETLDRTVGYIVYLPPEGPGQVHKLDLLAGWDTVTRICFPTIKWRDTKAGLIEQVTVTEFTPPPADAERIDWLRQRATAIKDNGCLAELAAEWPPGVPTLKQGGLTDAQVQQVADVLDQIEKRHSMSFGPTDPLFAAFAGADRQPDLTVQNPAPDPRDEARDHTAAAKTLLEQFDPAEAQAIALLVNPDKHDTNADHLQWISAVINELGHPQGAVIFTYSTLGPTIAVTDNAARILAECGTKTDALKRAKTLAKALGCPTPRAFQTICDTPILAALVAAGLGDADSSSNDDKELK